MVTAERGEDSSDLFRPMQRSPLMWTIAAEGDGGGLDHREGRLAVVEDRKLISEAEKAEEKSCKHTHTPSLTRHKPARSPTGCLHSLVKVSIICRNYLCFLFVNSCHIFSFFILPKQTSHKRPRDFYFLVFLVLSSSFSRGFKDVIITALVSSGPSLDNLAAPENITLSGGIQTSLPAPQHPIIQRDRNQTRTAATSGSPERHISSEKHF